MNENLRTEAEIPKTCLVHSLIFFDTLTLHAVFSMDLEEPIYPTLRFPAMLVVDEEVLLVSTVHHLEDQVVVEVHTALHKVVQVAILLQ